jgi:hypothetical protein
MAWEGKEIKGMVRQGKARKVKASEEKEGEGMAR